MRFTQKGIETNYDSSVCELLFILYHNILNWIA